MPIGVAFIRIIDDQYQTRCNKCVVLCGREDVRKIDCSVDRARALLSV